MTNYNFSSKFKHANIISITLFFISVILIIFKGLNYLGVLKSLKPLPVSRLADKMIGEIKNNKKVKFKLYSSLEI